jgi:hypothetical protein
VKLIRIVLATKIGFTVIWAALLLVAPIPFELAGIPVSEGMTLFLRLLGAAFSALLLGYCLAYRDVGRGRDISNTLRVGILSNSLAFLLLLYHGASGEWRTWHYMAAGGMWLSVVVTGAVTLGLVLVFSTTIPRTRWRQAIKGE